MIQFTIKTSDGNIRCTSPASWSELNIGQLIKLETEWDRESATQLFSIITGVDEELLKSSKDNGLEDTMLAICAFAYDQPQWDALPRPAKLQIGDEFYNTPDNIDKKTLGQKIMVSQIAIKEDVDLVKSIPKIIAIYMQEVIDGKYDDTRLVEVEESILTSPAIDCYGLALFFFQESGNLINIGEMSLTKSQPLIVPMEKLLSGLAKLQGSAGIVT